MSQGQFQVQRVKKQKERILLSYTLILHEQRFSRFRTQYLNKKLEIKTWTKNLNKELEHNTKTLVFKFKKLKNKRENSFSK